MKTIIETLVVLGLVWFVWWATFYIGWIPNYSEGERTVDVYKFSKKGIWWKSWEGEAYVGGIRSSGGDNPTLELEKFYFSIVGHDETKSAELIAKLQECGRTRERCTIQYRQWLKNPIYISSNYEVTGVITNSNNADGEAVPNN